jgi:hypothetical protein
MRWNSVIALAGLAVATAVVDAPGAQSVAPARQAPAPPESPGVRVLPVYSVRLTGDLVAKRLIERLREQLDAAGTAKAELVVLTIEGRRWRPEVARALADVVKASPVPVAALLGPGATVGGGQVLVALGASTCWIAPGTTIRTEPGDEVAVPPVAGSVVTPEPTGATEIVTKDFLPLALAEVLLAPVTPMYAAWESPERTLTVLEGAAPAGPGDPSSAAVALVTVERGAARTAISAESAVRLGIAKGLAVDAGQVLRALSLRGATTATHPVSDDLPARKTELHAAVASIRTLTSQASDRVSGSPKGDDPQDRDKRRRNGLSAVSICKRAGEELIKAEALAKDYPELLVEPAPESSSVGTTPESAVKSWQALFKDLRGDLSRVAGRAATAADAKR